MCPRSSAAVLALARDHHQPEECSPEEGAARVAAARSLYGVGSRRVTGDCSVFQFRAAAADAVESNGRHLSRHPRLQQLPTVTTLKRSDRVRNEQVALRKARQRRPSTRGSSPCRVEEAPHLVVVHRATIVGTMCIPPPVLFARQLGELRIGIAVGEPHDAPSPERVHCHVGVARAHEVRYVGEERQVELDVIGADRGPQQRLELRLHIGRGNVADRLIEEEVGVAVRLLLGPSRDRCDA